MDFGRVQRASLTFLAHQSVRWCFASEQGGVLKTKAFRVVLSIDSEREFAYKMDFHRLQFQQTFVYLFSVIGDTSIRTKDIGINRSQRLPVFECQTSVTHLCTQQDTRCTDSDTLFKEYPAPTEIHA